MGNICGRFNKVDFKQFIKKSLPLLGDSHSVCFNHGMTMPFKNDLSSAIQSLKNQLHWDVNLIKDRDKILYWLTFFYQHRLDKFDHWSDYAAIMFFEHGDNFLTLTDLCQGSKLEILGYYFYS